jgi:hypothetical protein
MSKHAGLLSFAQNSVSRTGQANLPATRDDVAARHGLRRRPCLVRDLAVALFNAVQLARCLLALALVAIDKLQQAWCGTQWDSNLGHVREPKTTAWLCAASLLLGKRKLMHAFILYTDRLGVR